MIQLAICQRRIDHRCLVVGIRFMALDDDEFAGVQASPDEADQTGQKHDQGEGHLEEENADERGSGKGDHERVLECTLADAEHGFDHHGQHRRLDAEKDGLDET
jgi:hypothetical protein